MAGKGGRRSTSWKPGQSGNPAGGKAKRPVRSLRWHVDQRFSDEDRARAIDAQITRARAGNGKSLELLAKLGGEVAQQPIARPPDVNVLAIIGEQPGGAELVARLFAALPLRAAHPGGLSSVRGSTPGT